MKITLAEIQFLDEILRTLQFQVGSSNKMVLAESLQTKLKREAVELLKAQKDADKKKDKDGPDKPPA